MNFMTATTRTRSPLHRGGFTLLELLVVNGLMVLLAVILATVWAGLGRPVADIANRSYLLQEMALASASLARDLGGSLAGPEGRLGTKEQGKFHDWTRPTESQLWLTFDGQPAPHDQLNTVEYYVEGGNLVRRDQNANTAFVVAHHVTDLVVTGDALACQIQLTFSYRDITRTCTWIARIP